MDVILQGNTSEASVPIHKSKSSMCAYTIVRKRVRFFSYTLAVYRGTFLHPKSVPLHTQWMWSYNSTIVGKKVTFFSCTLVAVHRGTFLYPKSVPLHTRWMWSYNSTINTLRPSGLEFRPLPLGYC